MSLRKVIAFGHSHLGAIDLACRSAAAREDLSYDLRTYQFLSSERPQFVNTDNRGWRYHDEIQRELVDLLEHHKPEAVAILMHGEQTISSGLLAPVKPYDFFFPDETDYVPDIDAEIVPFDLILRTYIDQFHLISEFLDSVKHFLPPLSFCMCPPPPVGDRQFILNSDTRHANISSHIEKFGLPSTTWRYRIWKISTMALRSIYRARGIGFVDPPIESLDENGCIRPEFRGDVFHANGAYGRLLLSQIDRMLRGTTRGERGSGGVGNCVLVAEAPKSLTHHGSQSVADRDRMKSNMLQPKDMGRRRPTIAVVGDSYQGQNYNFINANGRNLTLNGSVTFLNVLARQAFYIDIDKGFFIQGSSGTNFILSQLPSIISYRPDFLVFCAGHNDILQGLDLDTIQANFVKIIDTVAAAGIVPIMCLTGPQNTVQGSRFVTLDQARDLIVSLNRWKRDYASAHNLLLWDWYTPMADSAGGYAPGMSPDDIHPGFKAAYRVAKQGLTDLASIIPPPTTALQSKVIDPENLLPDAFFTKTGANIANPVIGVGPSGWTIRRYKGAAHGGSIINSIVPAEDGLGAWNRLTVHGATTGGTRSEEIGYYTCIYSGEETYRAGDELEAWLEINVLANSPFNGVLFSIGDHNGDTLQRQATNGGHAGGPNETIGPSEAWSGVLYCPKLTMTSSETGRPFVFVQIVVRWDAVGNDFSGVVEFRRPTIRKVVDRHR